MRNHVAKRKNFKLHQYRWPGSFGDRGGLIAVTVCSPAGQGFGVAIQCTAEA